jgi:hypothetical protein
MLTIVKFVVLWFIYYRIWDKSYNSYYLTIKYHVYVYDINSINYLLLNMKLLYVQEHTSCKKYMSDSVTGFKHFALKKRGTYFRN